MTLLLVAVLAIAALGAIVVLNQRLFIYHPSRVIVPPNFPGVKAERIVTDDGETLIAWHLPPSKPGAPMFLFFDGNAGRPEVWEHRWRHIADQGAGFLAVYYRGFSGSTGKPTEAGLFSDAQAGYKWLIAYDYGPRDIVIHGYSLGSGPAVHIAADHAARALILEAPYSGIDDVAKMYVGGFAFLVEDRFASRETIGRVHMPVLIVHGDRDRVVPFAQGERLFALANEPKQFVRMAGSNHANLVRNGLYDHIWAFLAQHPAE